MSTTTELPVGSIVGTDEADLLAVHDVFGHLEWEAEDGETATDADVAALLAAGEAQIIRVGYPD